MTIDPNLLKRHEIYDICVPPLLDHALVSVINFVIILTTISFLAHFPYYCCITGGFTGLSQIFK